MLRRADGSLFPVRFVSDFALCQRLDAGEDVRPILRERVRLGANGIRVLAMFDGVGIGGATGLGEFSPRRRQTLYQSVAALTDLAATYGLIVNWVYCADCDPRGDASGGLMTTRAEVQAHIDAMDAVLATRWNVLRQGANEPFKNLRDVHTYRFLRGAGTSPLDYGHGIVERGDASIPVADYVAPHDHERKPEWVRTARGLAEMREGGSWDLTPEERAAHPTWAESFDGVRCPVIAGEPMGFDEVEQPGRRTTSVSDAAAFAATAQMMAAGSVFHSTDGVLSRLFRPVTKQAAAAWLSAAAYVPPACQVAPYQRGGRGGGPGVGNMPVEHHDLEETVAPCRALRTFAKTVDGVAYVVRIRPDGPTIARDGWRVVDTLRPGIVRLTR